MLPPPTLPPPRASLDFLMNPAPSSTASRRSPLSPLTPLSAAPPVEGHDERYSDRRPSLSVSLERSLPVPVRPGTHHDTMSGTPRPNFLSRSEQRRHSEYPYSHQHHRVLERADHAVWESTHPASELGNPGGRATIVRTTQACDSCRKSKVRCHPTQRDEGQACNRCRDKDMPCVFSTQQKRRGPTPGTAPARSGNKQIARPRARRSGASASLSLSSSSESISPPLVSAHLPLEPVAEHEYRRPAPLPMSDRVPALVLPAPDHGSHRRSWDSNESIDVVTPDGTRQRGSMALPLPPMHHMHYLDYPGPAVEQERRVSYSGWSGLGGGRVEPDPTPLSASRGFFDRNYSVAAPRAPHASSGRIELPPLDSIRAPRLPNQYKQAPDIHILPPIGRKYSLFGPDGITMPPSPPHRPIALEIGRNRTASASAARSFWGRSNDAPAPGPPGLPVSAPRW